jgi:hypothetical protein
MAEFGHDGGVRRMTYVLVWLAVTTTAVLVAAAAVGSVRDHVTETPAAIVPITATTTSLANPATPTTEPAPAPTTSVPAPATTSTTTTIARSNTTVPSASTTTTRPPAPTTTTTAPPTTTTNPPPTEIRSYDLVGGSVTVEVGGNTVHLAGASPKAGFSVDVENSGPEKVEVEFKSEHHESNFSGQFEDGVFVPRIEEEEGHGEDD